MSEELVCHFGKHEGTAMGEIPSGYLRWAVKTIDPMPLPKYQKNEDGSQKTVEEVNEMKRAMSEFLKAAEVEIGQRDDDGE
jgi:hypothetical protein